jgi:hypothetical protein
VAQRFTAAITGLFSATALQIAEKLDFALAFGWRSGLPLRNRLVFSDGFSR